MKKELLTSKKNTLHDNVKEGYRLTDKIITENPTIIRIISAIISIPTRFIKVKLVINAIIARVRSIKPLII
jgi:hypothetical protein